MPRGSVVAVVATLVLIICDGSFALAQTRSKKQPSAAKTTSAPRYHTAQGQAGHEELMALVRWFAQNNIAWNLPHGLRRTFDNSAKIGDVFAPALNSNRRGGVFFDFEDMPPGRVQKWSEVGSGRSFFMYWVINPLGQLGDLKTGGPGTVALLETRLPLPLRRQVIVVAQYQGLKTFQNDYGEEVRQPLLRVIAAAVTNGYYYVDSDWQFVDGGVEYFFDDEALGILKKRLKPFVDDPEQAAAAASEQPPGAADLASPATPPTTHAPESDKRVANMSSDELNKWLRRQGPGPSTSPVLPTPTKSPLSTAPNTPKANNSPNLSAEEISFFGWRRGDKTKFKIGVAVGHERPRIESKEGASLLRTVENVTRTKDRVIADVLDTTWANYGLNGSPAGKTKMRYVAEEDGIYADVEIVEGPNRGVKTRTYIARFPLKENLIDEKYGTVLRKFGRPSQMPSSVPDENCILIKVDAGLFKHLGQTYEYHTYCQGAGLVSVSDDAPDLEAGVPGPASTFVYLVDKFDAGPDEDAALPERSPKRIPAPLRAKVVSDLDAAKLSDYPREHVNKLVLIEGLVQQVVSANGKSYGFGIAESGKVYLGWQGALNYLPLTDEKYLSVGNIVILRDNKAGKYAFVFQKGMEVPRVGQAMGLTGKYLGNTLRARGSSGLSELAPGVYLEAVDSATAQEE